VTLVRFKAKNHPQQVATGGPDADTDDRRTPAALFDPLHAVHRFTLDAAASARNAKCARCFDAETDGLAASWAGERVWCNPPYSDIGPWVAKAWAEMNDRCRLVVMLLPANRCEQAWWQDMVEPRRDRSMGLTTKFLRGRHRFERPGVPTPKGGDRPPFGLVLLTWDGVTL